MWRATAVAVVATIGALALGACSVVELEGEATAPVPVGAPPAPAGLDCSEEWLGEDDTVDIVTAYAVVDGALGQACLGDGDAGLVGAWELLRQLVPAAQLADLVVFAGFEDVSGSDEGTLAFVTVYDDAGEEFQLSVNLDELEDTDELTVTLAHEWSHVLNGTPDQLDRFADQDACATWWNGEGCYAPTAVMTAWLDAFWGDLLGEIDPEVEASADGGEDRCRRDARFLGAYAASSPEEDFGEAFAAWVLRIPPADEAQQASNDFLDERPELATYRELAIANGLGPLEHAFEACGI